MQDYDDLNGAGVHLNCNNEALCLMEEKEA